MPEGESEMEGRRERSELCRPGTDTTKREERSHRSSTSAEKARWADWAERAEREEREEEDWAGSSWASEVSLREGIECQNGCSHGALPLHNSVSARALSPQRPV